MLRSDILQNDLDVEGEFMTEETMREKGWSEPTVIELIITGFMLYVLILLQMF